MPTGKQFPHWYFDQSGEESQHLLDTTEFRTSLGLCESDKRSLRPWSFPQEDAFWTARVENHVGIHQPLASCCSSFWSCFSSFEMFTRCIIRNWPFKWKTGMSNLYLSYQAEFSGSVMSTSCKINWNRDRLKLYILENMEWCSDYSDHSDKLIPRLVLMLRGFLLLLVCDLTFLISTTWLVSLYSVIPDFATFLVYLLQSSSRHYSVPNNIKHVPTGKLPENQERHILVLEMGKASWFATGKYFHGNGQKFKENMHIEPAS